MEKPALTKYEIHPIIKRRWSPRSFEDRMVEKQKLQKLFEAARWAPSSFNMQPWKFIVGFIGTPSYDKIMDTLIDFNRSWAKLAPVLVMVAGKEVNSKGKPNATYQYDTGQSVAYLTFQATHLDLHMHQMSGFNRSKAIDNFSIDKDHKPIAVFALGYISTPEKLPGDLQEMEKKERKRNDFDDFVFEEEFGKSLQL